jgi:hypothetical protein
MHTMSFPVRSSAVFCILMLVLSGCGDTETQKWTVQEGALTLTETLRITEGPDFYFGEIYDVAVDEAGHLYVADGQAKHVKVLAPDGTPQDTIGRPGDGPGEFRYPSRLGFTNTDSLYVMDGRRVAVFGPEREFQYRFRTQGASGAPRNMMVPSEGGGAFFAYLPFPDEVAKTGARAVVRHVGSNSEVGDTLLAVRPRQARPDGGPLPFSRLSLFDLGPDDTLHHAWSGALDVTAYDQSGQKRRTVEIPFDPVPVSAEERKSALDNRSKEERAALREHMPETKPAFDRFRVDDEGRYWFGRPTANPDSTAWWVALPDENRVVTDTLPSGIRLLTVRGGHAYGRATTEAGAPALVRYTIDLGK